MPLWGLIFYHCTSQNTYGFSHKRNPAWYSRDMIYYGVLSEHCIQHSFLSHNQFIFIQPIFQLIIEWRILEEALEKDRP